MKSNQQSIAYFLIGNFITYLGNGIQILGAAYVTFLETQSILSIGGVFLTYAIPQVAIAYFSLDILKKFGARTICISSDFIRGVLIGMIFISLWFDQFVVETVFAVTAASSLFDAIYQPASNSLFQYIVKLNKLDSARFSSRLEVSTQAAVLLSVTVGALAGHLFGAAAIFGLNSASFILSGILFSFIPKTINQIAIGTANNFALYKHAIKHYFPDILNFSLVRAVPNTMNTVTIFFVIATLQQNLFVLGIVDAVASLGFMFGSLFYARHLSKMRPEIVMISTLSLTAIFIYLQPLYELYFMSAMLLAATLAFGISRVSARANVINTTDGDISDAIYAAANLLGLFLAIILTIIVCWVQPQFGINFAYITVATFILIVALIVLRGTLTKKI